MKISYNWLNDFIDITIKPAELAEILTNIGLEVEAMEEYEEVKGGLKGVIIGEVLTCRKHPNADKLSLTTVNIGSVQPINVV
jgi:phenylalanyl-tRNA synthetase beta chain